MDNDTPHIVVIDGKLYGYGETRSLAINDFKLQIAGAPPRMQSNMRGRCSVVRIDDDQASEVAEMLAAPW